MSQTLLQNPCFPHLMNLIRSCSHRRSSPRILNEAVVLVFSVSAKKFSTLSNLPSLSLTQQAATWNFHPPSTCWCSAINFHWRLRCRFQQIELHFHLPSQHPCSADSLTITLTLMLSTGSTDDFAFASSITTSEFLDSIGDLFYRTFLRYNV